jgi:hypothetical protein
MTTLTQARHCTRSGSRHNATLSKVLLLWLSLPFNPLKPITLVKQTCSDHHCVFKNCSPYPSDIFCSVNQKEAVCLVREEELNTKVTNEALFALTFINTLPSLKS